MSQPSNTLFSSIKDMAACLRQLGLALANAECEDANDKLVVIENAVCLERAASVLEHYQPEFDGYIQRSLAEGGQEQ